MIEPFFRTDQSITRLIQRIALGLVILPHGLQKLLGWAGGYGLEQTASHFATLGVPPLLTMLVVLSETVGSIALVLGAFTRLAAIGVVCTMFGAIALVHAKFGFFMNWSGRLGGEGFEYHLLAIALALPLVLFGGGKWALDHLVTRRLATRDEKPLVTE